MSQHAASAATGPRSPEGKAISALNSTTHGLTSKSPVLPSEDPQDFANFRAAVLARYAPETPEQIAVVQEYCDLSWRLRRVPSHEASLIAFEIKRMTLEAKTDKVLAELLDGLDSSALEAVAFDRLCRSKTLSNLHRQESNLSRRLARLQPQMNVLLEIQHRRQQQTQRQPTAPPPIADAVSPHDPSPASSATLSLVHPQTNQRR
jgi:hypothetical protein